MEKDFTKRIRAFKNQIANAENELNQNGWFRTQIGFTQKRCVDEEFVLYARKRALATILQTKKNVFSADENTTESSKNAENTKVLAMGTKTGMMASYIGLSPVTPLPNESCFSAKDFLSEDSIFRNDFNIKLNNFNDYASLKALESESRRLVIAYDSEWSTVDNITGERYVLSWQFSVVFGCDVYEFVFLRKTECLLSITIAIGCILSFLPLRALDRRSKVRYYTLTDGYVEKDYATVKRAEKECQYIYPDGCCVHAVSKWKSDKVTNITLLCHTGVADITALDPKDNIISHCTEIQGGLVTINRKDYLFFDAPKYNDKSGKCCNFVYPVCVNVRDTMCHASSGKSLATLGKSVGIAKIETGDYYKANMDLFFLEKPCNYIEYASNDSLITLLYAASLYGFNHTIPVSLISKCSNIIKDSIKDYLECSSDEAFDLKYRGVIKVTSGTKKNPDGLGFLTEKALVPYNDDAAEVIRYAAESYHGGYNASLEIGHITEVTRDFDLTSAYLLAESLIPDVDWKQSINEYIVNRELTMDDFLDENGICNPFDKLIFAKVQFQFPSKVKFPCIPIRVNGLPTFVLSSENERNDCIYANGIDLFLALKLGATVFVKTGYILNTLPGKYSIGHAVKALAADRKTAELYRKNVSESHEKSQEELLLKTMACSVYGKTGQDVRPKRAFDVYSQSMREIGGSSITNAVTASLTTAIVRCCLLAALNECHEKGFKSYSVTTDGFIANVPLAVLNSLDLYGIADHMKRARRFLTDNETELFWEVKHDQGGDGNPGLLNFTTRGNVGILGYSPDKKAVCAHNGLHSVFNKESLADRLHLFELVCSRESYLINKSKQFTPMRELRKGKPFTVTEKTSKLSMDFDMKRRPERKSVEKQYVTLPPITDAVISNLASHSIGVISEIIPEILETSDTFEAKYEFLSKLLKQGNSLIYPGKTMSYEFAHFDTQPFKNVSEFLLYRKKASLCKVLRTYDDWALFFGKVEADASHAKIRDLDWSIIRSCIIGYRHGLWDIPKLNVGTLKEKLEWINSHNSSKTFVYNVENWKSARKERDLEHVLPKEMLQEKLEELINDI